LRILIKPAYAAYCLDHSVKLNPMSLANDVYLAIVLNT